MARRCVGLRVRTRVGHRAAANSGNNAVQTLPRASPGPYIGTAGAGDGGVNWQHGRRSSRPGGHLGDLGCTPYANGTVGLVCGVTVVDPADPLLSVVRAVEPQVVPLPTGDAVCA